MLSQAVVFTHPCLSTAEPSVERVTQKKFWGGRDDPLQAFEPTSPKAPQNLEIWLSRNLDDSGVG
jgi:hypothetical protein